MNACMLIRLLASFLDPTFSPLLVGDSVAVIIRILPMQSQLDHRST